LEFLKVGATRRVAPTVCSKPEVTVFLKSKSSSTKKSLENKNFSRILKVKMCLAEFKGEIKL